MIRTPNGKNLMNLQEAVQWLLDNNALPFQCTADYVAGAEIGLGTIVNPSPANVRVGSLIFFADSKVSTVIAITSNSFICSDEYNDLVDDIVYVSNVQLNASGHLIVTLSNGTDIDAGLIKQVSGFSIDASQHLIVSYNDGTSTDLGAIFNGNITISGNLAVGGSISSPSITEINTGFAFSQTWAGLVLNYVGAVKTGNKVTFAIAGEFDGETGVAAYGTKVIGSFTIPSAVGSKLYPDSDGRLAYFKVVTFTSIYNNADIVVFIGKNNDNNISFYLATVGAIAADYTGKFRVEATFLLSDSLN